MDLTGFITQPSYPGNCQARPPGTVCATYDDKYIWLIDEPVTGWTKNQNIQGAIGSKNIFLHILNTKQVKKVPKP